jgi:predicted adenine nucleotide alpha hydrolase (AANH) superfamily ATPase
MSQETVREKLCLPANAEKLLLHSCCAPCSGELMEALSASGIVYTIFFYNPNIHPRKEYEIRKDENIRFALKMGVDFVDADYDTSNWFARVKGLEFEPERGARCTACFDMRFERTALYAHEHDFKVIVSSLGLSRWKDMGQINGCGVKAAARYEGMVYWTHNWRKKGGSARMYEISKREEFYQQEYCGCVYSLRDSNLHRVQKGLGRIEMGKNFYGN